jgi:uncharacterized membrane protein YccC
VTYYERAKPAADELERAFYGALEAADRYAALMDALAEEEEGRPEPNPELVRRLRHQRSEVGELASALEAAPLEALLRIIDRVLMIKRTEEGEFV